MLFVITLVINVLSRLLIWSVNRKVARQDAQGGPDAAAAREAA